MMELTQVLFRRFGRNPLRYLPGTLQLLRPPDFSEESWSVLQAVGGYTMTSPERVSVLLDAVHYAVRNAIPGSIVECGVWRGGSMMAIALTLLKLNSEPRDLYLFDTFEGMPKPQEVDVDMKGRLAKTFFSKWQTGEDSSDFCRASLEEVRQAMNSTAYPPDRVHLVKGRVEETIPQNAPATIALLRLDTDWYESTKHELEHLFPRLAKGGILIIDDYGHWQGARRAVDEYFAEPGRRIFLSRIDYTGRVAVKLE